MKKKKTQAKRKVSRKRKMTLIIGYARVSTEKQGVERNELGKGGLSVAAQKAAIAKYATAIGGRVLATYAEAASGKKARRVELLKAIAHARRSGAVLAVGDLDRLTRNLHQLTGLMQSGVKFVD